MPDDPQKHPLDYRDPKQDRLQNRYGQLALGIFGGILAAVTIFGLGIAWTYENIDIDATTHPYHLPSNWNLPVVATIVSFGVWMLILNSGRSRVFVLAVLIGFGIALLIEGACFAFS